MLGFGQRLQRVGPQRFRRTTNMGSCVRARDLFFFLSAPNHEPGEWQHGVAVPRVFSSEHHFRETLVVAQWYRQIHLTRHFLMQFTHLITCISHCMAQDEPPNVFCVFDRPLVVGPRSVLPLFLSVVYLISSILYLYSARHSISNVENAEG